MITSSLSQLARQEKTRREILHKSDLVPPLPDLVSRLLELLGGQDTEPRDLEELLRNDQVLVAKMLAMVNSPFYGLNRPVCTIKEAVMVLGFRGVRSLVLATGTAKLLQRDFGAYGHEPRGLWRHAVCVAAGARQLALGCGLPRDDAEQLFVSGLLHDIGKLLLVAYVQAGPAPLGARSVAEHERATVGLDHAEAGALVTAKWNLSREIQQVIGAHHAGAPAGDLDPTTAKAAAVVRLADAAAHATGIGYADGCAPPGAVDGADLAALGLDEPQWARVELELTTTMEEAVAALGDLGS